MKKTLALLLAVLLIAGFLPVTAKAEGNGPVTVYLSVSDDAEYVNTAAQGVTPTVMALKQITVPYFDIGVYGLSSYYYNPNCYSVHDFTPAHQNAGTQSTAAGYVTLLHVMIYALEVFYFGNSPANVGDQANHNDLSSVLAVSGTPGSIYFTNYWGNNFNFQYFVNYACPVAYDHWGATADQYLAQPNSIISIGHFSDMSFYQDSNGIFTYAKPTGGNISAVTVPDQDNEVDLTFYHAFANLFANDTDTTHTAYGSGITVRYHDATTLSSGNVADWTAVDSTCYQQGDSLRVIINTEDWDPGTYIFAIAGQPGTGSPSNICSTPGGILVTVS